MVYSTGLISAIVSSEAGRPAGWSIVNPPRSSLMGQVIDYLISQANTDLCLIAVDDPYVEIVSYADLVPPIILIGISHFRRLNDITQIVQLELPNEDVAIDISKQVILASLADCFILRDNEELAVRSYVLSILGCSSLYAPTPFEHLFEDQVSVRQLIFQYYGIAHEIGHCATTRHAADRTWLYVEGYSGRGQNRLVISACQKLETARFPGELSYHTQFSRTRAATCIIPLDSPGMKSQISAS